MITRLTEAWLDRAAALEKRAGEVGWTRDHFARELTLPASFFIVDVEQTVLRGYAGFWKIVQEAQIMNVVVAPEYRRQGIGRGLLQFLVAEAGRLGCVRGTLDVRATNDPALRLYMKEGFKPVGRRPQFYGHIDAILMDKTL